MAFVTTSGTKFMLDGQEFRPFGANIYNNLQTTASITARVNEGVSANFNIFRLINYLEHEPETDEFAEAVWTEIDHALDQARLNNVKMLLDLSDYTTIRANRTTWADMMQNESFTTFLDWLLNRVNTVNGRVYKNDDALAIITIAGEIDSEYDDYLADFYDRISSEIKAIDTNHLVATGAVEYYNPIEDVYAVEGLDIIGSHVYQNNLGHNGQIVPNMKLHQRLSQQYDKPWYIEEFGEVAGVGDIYRANYMRKIYNWGLKYGCQGFLFWNWGPPGLSGFDVSLATTPKAYRNAKLFSYIKGYAPRIPVDAAISAGYPA